MGISFGATSHNKEKEAREQRRFFQSLSGCLDQFECLGEGCIWYPKES